MKLATNPRRFTHDAGGIALEFPVHHLQETARTPIAALAATSPNVAL